MITAFWACWIEHLPNKTTSKYKLSEKKTQNGWVFLEFTRDKYTANLLHIAYRCVRCDGHAHFMSACVCVCLDHGHHCVMLEFFCFWFITPSEDKNAYCIIGAYKQKMTTLNGNIYETKTHTHTHCVCRACSVLTFRFALKHKGTHSLLYQLIHMAPRPYANWSVHSTLRTSFDARKACEQQRCWPTSGPAHGIYVAL